MTIVLEYEKCTGCGLCAVNCVASHIVPDAVKGVRLNEQAAAYCASCGQCEAICPAGAVRVMDAGVHPAFPGQDVPDITADQLNKFLLSRRSVRHFRDEPVDRAAIGQILDTVRYAPSAGNGQPIRWIIVSGRKRVSQIADLAIEGRLQSLADDPAQYSAMSKLIRAARARGEDPVCRHAPHLAVAAVPAASPFRHADATIALAWFELAAYSRGLGACWAGGVQLVADEYGPLRMALGVPDGYVSGYVLMFGYPRYRFHHVPPRKPADVTWLE